MITMKNIKKVYILELIVEGKDSEEIDKILETIANSLKPLCKSVSYKNLIQERILEAFPERYRYHCEISCVIEIKDLNENLENSNLQELITL